MNETERRKSQSTNILLALQSGRKLTCLDMLRDFHCGNGKGRIHELRKTHPEIEDEWITTEGGARVKRWFIPFPVMNPVTTEIGGQPVDFERLRERLMFKDATPPLQPELFA